VTLTTYTRDHLAGIVALCAAEDWPSFGADLDRAHVVLTAPGVTTVVALDGELVIGFAYALSDGHIAAYLSMMAVHKHYRRKGVGRDLVEYVFPLTGAQRMDLVTHDAGDFYRSFEHRTFEGFRIYPG
jgi:ribosomal protein S18 acetylase RimI-like enzyme